MNNQSLILENKVVKKEKSMFVSGRFTDLQSQFLLPKLVFIFSN